MILIADGGSTKTEWCVVDEKRGVALHTVLTAGMNPYFQSPGEMAEEVEQTLFPAVAGYQIRAVYFYGAGCAFPEKSRMVEEVIRRCLPVPVKAHSDLMGAAYSLCDNRAGIACILGTGSNSCLFDGKEIRDQISPLGYILGDEGSGAVLGKILVGDCLKRQLPEPLIRKFMQQYSLTPATILERVYKQPFPNRFLASFSPFLLEHITEPAIHNIVFTGFRNFFLRNVMQYEDYGACPVHFTGSIAFYYREILEEVALSLGIQTGKIEKSPIPGLVSFHTQK